mmetsp:Transcript_19360/g.49646  ORF Transcript_19360/g.49646 Transcript_19360/m.49646 type:complete len:290 (-) Transcript_19360:238-1107(-)
MSISGTGHSSPPKRPTSSPLKSAKETPYAASSPFLHNNCNSTTIWLLSHLIDDFKHCPLHLIIASRLITTSTTNSIYLIDENDASAHAPSHLEQLSYQPGTLTHVFLNELTSNYANKRCICPVCDSTSAQCLAGTRRTVQQDTLGWIDSKGQKFFRVKHGQLDHFSQFFDHLLVTSDIIVCDIRLLLYLHHRHGGVDSRGKWNLNGILIPFNPYSHSLFNISGSHSLSKPDHKLRNLTEIDQVLVLFRFFNDFCTACNLQGVLLLHHLLVGNKIPHAGRRKPCICLFHT